MGTGTGQNPVNFAPLTEEVWVSWRRICFAALKWKHIRRDRPDCISYLLTDLPRVWQYWDKDKSSWDNFAFSCAKNKICDWLKIENRTVNLTRRGPSRAVAIDDLSEKHEHIFRNRRTREPVDIVAYSELVSILWLNLTPLQKKEFVRWYNGEPGHTKSQDNKRTMIKKKARMLFSESLPEMFSNLKGTRRPQLVYIPQERLTGVMGEHVMSERFRIFVSGGVLHKAASARRKRQKK